jgi:hypothetical protein
MAKQTGMNLERDVLKKVQEQLERLSSRAAQLRVAEYALRAANDCALDLAVAEKPDPRQLELPVAADEEITSTEQGAKKAAAEHGEGFEGLLSVKLELTRYTLKEALGALGIEAISYAYGPIGDEQRIIEPDGTIRA